MWRVGIVAIVLLGAQLLSSSSESPAAQRLLTQSSVRTVFFPVNGKTLEGLFSDLGCKGPRDQFGIARDAVTRWSIWWRWPKDDVEGSRFLRTRVKTRVTVELPAAEGIHLLNIDSQREFRRYYAALVTHEYQHVANAIRTARSIERSIKEQARRNSTFSESDAHSLASRLIRRNQEWDLEFDRKTDHGRKQGVFFGEHLRETVNACSTLDVNTRSIYSG